MSARLEGTVADHLAVFERGTVDLIERKQLERKLERALAEQRPLRVKLGLDPSSPDLHVGHAIPLLKLRDLQQLGHQVVLIVGDSTAMVGDPSGRNKLRPTLTREQVDANLETYTSQAGRVIDMERTEVRRNSEWFDQMGFEELLGLMGRMTVARMLERDTFARRMQASEPIGIHEFLYPLMQGWDSVMIQSDAELGGNDQLFNLLVGRQLQEGEDQETQVCFTTPLINGLDGRKMSKSYGNAIGVTDAPNDMFGKVMSVEDGVMRDWFTLLTRLDMDEIERVLAGHPREAKARLAAELVGAFHGEAAGREAREAFDRQFRDKQLPSDIPAVAWPGEEGALPLANLLSGLGLAKSSSEARRLVAQGGVRLDGEVQADATAQIARPSAELLVQVGKRRFARVTPQE